MKDPLRPVIEIETPEHVIVSMELSGLGRRGSAAAYDLLLQCAITGVIVLLAIPILGMSFGGLQSLAGPVGAGLLILNLLVWWGYHTAFEVLRGGQTPGKRLLRIRVVCADGRPVTFFPSMVRNLVRVVDWFPSGYGIGLVVSLVSRRYQRLGDLAGGTIVVLEAPESLPAHVVVDLDRVPLPEDLKAAAGARISAVTQSEYDYLVRLLGRLPDVGARNMGDAFALAYQTAVALFQRMGLQPPTRQFDYGFCLVFLQMVATLYGQRSVRA